MWKTERHLFIYYLGLHFYKTPKKVFTEQYSLYSIDRESPFNLRQKGPLIMHKFSSVE